MHRASSGERWSVSRRRVRARRRPTVEAGERRQTKYLQAGSGFLSQHSKEVFFGLGKTAGPVRATVRWPSGAQQSFTGLMPGNRITIEEGAEKFEAKPFAAMAASREPL